MQLKLTEKDLAYDPAAQAEAMRRLRAMPARRSIEPPKPKTVVYRKNIVTFRDPATFRTIYMEPIGPSNAPARTIYPHPIGPRGRDILYVNSVGARLVQTRRSEFDTILSDVCRKYGVTPSDILSGRRTLTLTVPRHEVFYRLKHETMMSLPQMGQLMNGRDHTTALSSIRRYTKLLAEGKVSL